MLELIGQSGTNIDVTDEMGANMSAVEIAKREFGSKCLLAGWNFYVTLIFCLKGVMLCLYSRMTYVQSCSSPLDIANNCSPGSVFGRESLSSGHRLVPSSLISVSWLPFGGIVLLSIRTGRFILTQVVSVLLAT